MCNELLMEFFNLNVMIDLRVRFSYFNISEIDRDHIHRGMPVSCITWLGEVPGNNIAHRVVQQVLPITSEERDGFTIFASYWRTCLISEKVIICGSQVFSCTIRDNILTLVPDHALNISRLIWMWDAERTTVDEVTLESIQQAMSF